MNPNPSPRRKTPMLTELDREWERLRTRPCVVRAARRWTGDVAFTQLVRSIRDLDDIVLATQPTGPMPESANAILRQLIALAAADELAGRVVLQRLLPGLISQSRRWMDRAVVDDPTDVAIGAAWMAIRAFDVNARQQHVAPALIADSLWIAFRRGARRRVETEVPVSGSSLCGQPAPAAVADPIVALAATLRAARRAGVRSSDLDAIRTIAAAGGPTRAAHESGVTVRTIRNRRDRAGLRIRRALGADFADWTDPLAA